MSKALWLVVVAGLVLLLVAVAQKSRLSDKLMASSACESAPASAPNPVTPATQYASSAPSPFHHMKIDLPNRQIIIQAQVCLNEGPLEMLLCRVNSKEYESILSTHASPSALHAALLALDLTPGKPARSTFDADTKITTAIPPRGAGLRVQLRWKDSQGRLQQADAAKWLLTPGDGKKPELKHWIFVGSDILPDGRYWADVDGEIISVANFSASVLDVPFESSNQNGILVYQANTEAIPPKGTQVDVVLQVLEDAHKSPHARLILEVDRFGRCSHNGRVIPHDQLVGWAQQYIDRHARGEVALRVDGMALADDIRRIQLELRIGGLYDVDPQIVAPSSIILPRTQTQARESLKQWQLKFDNPKDFIRDPGDELPEVLIQINEQLAELEATRALLGEYLQMLNASLTKYKATSQAATPPAGNGHSSPTSQGD